MPYLNISGKNLYYELEGNGTPIVFIHGAMGTHAQWTKQSRVFSENYQVCTIDLPGHGRSENISEEISIVTYASVITEAIRRLELENSVICGHSMGGAIAFQIALDGSNSLSALVGVGTGAKLGVHPDILTKFRIGFRETVDLIYNQWAFSKNTERSVMEAVKAQVLETNSNIALADWEACDAFDCRVRLQEESLHLPTLMIVGEEDKLTPVRYSEYLVEQLPDSTMKMIPNAGHYVMLEQPEQFNHALLSFLQCTL